MKKKYYNSINILRIGFALIIACIVHYMIIMSGEYYSEFVGNEILDLSYMGVEIFFAISGFFAYVSYSNKIIADNLRFFPFIWSRIKRLYPAMIISVIVIAAAQWISYSRFGHYAILDYNDGRNTILAFVLSVLGINCGWVCNHDTLSINGVTWYISILMICYVLFYVFAVLSKKRKEVGYAFIGLMMLLGFIIIVLKLNIPLLYMSNGRGYLDFFGGVLIAVIYTGIDTDKYKKHMIIIGLVLAITYVVLRIMVSRDYLSFMCSFLFNPGIMLIFLNVGFLDRISNNKVVKYLGKISFDIYLFNMPVFAWIVLITLMCGFSLNYRNVGIWAVCALVNVLFAMLIRFILDRIRGAMKRKGKKNK